MRDTNQGEVSKKYSKRIKLYESKKFTRVPQTEVKFNVSRIDCVLENRERQIESTWCLSLGMVGLAAHSFLSKCDNIILNSLVTCFLLR